MINDRLKPVNPGDLNRVRPDALPVEQGRVGRTLIRYIPISTDINDALTAIGMSSAAKHG